MRYSRNVVVVVAVGSLLVAAQGLAAEKFLLQAEVPTDESTQVSVTLEVGGELLVSGDEGEQKLPLQVNGKQRYREQMVVWTPAAENLARSVRQYDQAEAQIQVGDQHSHRKLHDPHTWVLGEIRDSEAIFNGGAYPFTREEVDLVEISSNTLALDRLLPGREIEEGEAWRHSAEVWKAILCMDHVAVCEVRSVLTEHAGRDVKLRVAGTVHGTVDGAPTEIDLRGAYLFNLNKKRITVCNLAIKEQRKSSEFTPGLDVVAKVQAKIEPQRAGLKLPEKLAARVKNTAKPISRLLAYDEKGEGFRFLYDRAWYVTAEERNQFAFRYLHDHTLTAHCNVAVLPPRSAGRHTRLEEFERDVRQSLEDKLDTVVAATQWETARGYECLGIIANGTVDQIPVQWRNYLVAADDCPRLSLGVTLEQSQSEKFHDAERQMIETLELMPVEQNVPSTAQSETSSRTR